MATLSLLGNYIAAFTNYLGQTPAFAVSSPRATSPRNVTARLPRQRHNIRSLVSRPNTCQSLSFSKAGVLQYSLT